MGYDADIKRLLAAEIVTCLTGLQDAAGKALATTERDCEGTQDLA